MYLKLKFCQSAILYISKQNKIDYIRKYYKNTTFEVIKAKANPMSTNIYLTISKIIQNLENIFSKFDKIAKSDLILYNPKFGMAILNSKKTFD